MWCHYADFSPAAFQLFTLDVGRALGLEDLEFSLSLAEIVMMRQEELLLALPELAIRHRHAGGWKSRRCRAWLVHQFVSRWQPRSWTKTPSTSRPSLQKGELFQFCL